MYSSEDLERFYFEYQTEWMPRGMSIQVFCSRNNILHKALDGFIRQLSRKVVELQIEGKPEEDQSKRMQTAIVSPEPGEVFIVMSKGHRLTRLFVYDRISYSLYEKRFVSGYEFIRVERALGGSAVYHSIVSTLRMQERSVWEFFGKFFRGVVTGEEEYLSLLGLGAR